MLAGALLARQTSHSPQDVPCASAEGARPAGKSGPRELQSSSLSALGGSRSKTGASGADPPSPTAPTASDLEGRRITLAGRSGPLSLLHVAVITMCLAVRTGHKQVLSSSNRLSAHPGSSVAVACCSHDSCRSPFPPTYAARSRPLVSSLQGLAKLGGDQ